MSCSYDEAVDQIHRIFRNTWEAWNPEAYPVIYQDDPPKDGIGTPTTDVWARATIRHESGFQSSLTAPSDRLQIYTNTGIITVQVFVKIGMGLLKGYEIAQIVANGFRKPTASSVWFRNVRITEIGASGLYRQTNVLSDFTYDDAG